MKYSKPNPFILILSLLFIVSCVGETPVGPPPRGGYYKNEPVVYKYKYDEVWSATVAAVKELTWDIETTDNLNGEIKLLPSYIYNPKFAEYRRVYAQPTNKEIENSKVLPYLRRISYFEKITPPPAPPHPTFIKERLNLQVTSLTPDDTEVRINYKIMPYFDYKIGYLGTVRSRGHVEKMLFDKINETLMKSQIAEPELPPPPPQPPSFDIGTELSDVFFDFDKSDIRPDAIPVLQKSAELLRENPDLNIVIEGYADIRGTVEYNIRLAQRRASAAKTFLIGMGIDPVRIVSKSMGKTERFAPGTTEEAYQLNRRDHFIPIKPGTGTGIVSTSGN